MIHYITLWRGMQAVGQKPFARSATSLGASPHHCKAHHLRLVATSFICAADGNDVSLRLNDVVPYGTTEKTENKVLGFLAYPTGFEPAASRVGVLRAIQLCHG